MSEKESVVQSNGNVNPVFSFVFSHHHLKQKPFAGNHLLCFFLVTVAVCDKV